MSERGAGGFHGFGNAYAQVGAATLEDVERVRRDYLRPESRTGGWYVPAGNGARVVVSEA